MGDSQSNHGHRTARSGGKVNKRRQREGKHANAVNHKAFSVSNVGRAKVKTTHMKINHHLSPYDNISFQ